MRGVHTLLTVQFLVALGAIAQDDEAPWQRVERQYLATRAALAEARPDVRTWQRTEDELWVYDNRTELGMGMHQTLPEQLDLVQALGIRLVRVTLYWAQMEPAPGEYDADYLAQWDARVRAFEERDMELLVVVHGNPPGVSWETRQTSYHRFAEFVGAMAQRYPSVRYWELFNEMDSGFTDLFGHGVEPAVPMLERGKHYAEMLKLAYPAIKDANPEAMVLIGGMTDWTDFPRGIYEGGGREFFDIMNLHTYGVPVVWSVVTRGAELRQLMADYGDADRPLWNTELGIDAGNIAEPWGFPRDADGMDGDGYDRIHLEQWRECLEAAFETGLYAKVIPYQYSAGNERMNDVLATAEYASDHLPEGMTIDDYGFGIVRSDGLTPRPTYDWLLERNWNQPLLEAPRRTVDVIIDPAPEGDPVGCEFERVDGAMVLRGVEVGRSGPTRITLASAETQV